MTREPSAESAAQVLRLAARLAIEGREEVRPLDPAVRGAANCAGLNIPLGRQGRDPLEVLEVLDAAARPGLTGTTKPGFMGWVIGGSDPVGIGADWLAASWGQNACLHDSSPAAAQAEAAVSSWLLEVLDLPRKSSVGFATGATMAAFTCLAAARLAVLERAGHDFEKQGLFGCPEIAIYIAEDAHVTNYAVLRYLGFGSDQIRRVPSIENGTFDLDSLEQIMRADAVQARIVIGQAGHIMTGAFDDFTRLSRLCRDHSAWLHIDGAFGLWVRASGKLGIFAEGIEQADSWSVDAHKWLQVPYDLGFAIVRDEHFHRRAMSMQAGYLPEEYHVRNNSDYVPELSRRARGFAAWAVMQSLGRLGIAEMVERHCDAAHRLARAIRLIEGAKVINTVCLNQLAVAFDASLAGGAQHVANSLNATGQYFVRTASWQGREVLRLSITCGETSREDMDDLAFQIERICKHACRVAA